MIGFAVIGAGPMGRLHARAIARRASRVGDCELRFVVDRHAVRSEAVAREFGGQALSSVQSLIAEDSSITDEQRAAVVAVPTRSHAEVASSLLAQNFDVLIEKPMTGELSSARALVDQARVGGRILSVGHIEWWNAGLRAALALAGSPRRIEIVRYNPPSDRGLDIDVVQDLMLHDLDWIRRCIPSQIASVAAKGRARQNVGLDEAEVELEFASGARAILRASRVHSERQRELVIEDGEKTVRLDLLTGRTERVVRSEDSVPESPAEVAEDVTRKSPEEPLDAQLADFVDAVKLRREPVNSGAIGLETLALVERVREIIAAPVNAANAADPADAHD